MATAWQFVGTCVDGQAFKIDGVDVWSTEWLNTRQVASVTDPAYGQQFTFPVYEIETDRGKAVFAAGEFSNCIWGFYIPKAG